MEQETTAQDVLDGRTVLGIELGSTRIKAILIGPDHAPLASGAYSWESRLEEGLWTYHLDDVWRGIQTAYAEMAAQVKEWYGVPLSRPGALGVSAMMHGYLPFDREGRQLADFRTWRNTNTAQAAEELTDCLGFNIPQRWSAAHLYQAVLNGESHVGQLDFLTTLAGYVHWQLTGEKVLGVGDASGMFPIDPATGDYHQDMLDRFDGLLRAHGHSFTLRQVLPKVLPAGASAGSLTAIGAKLLDPTGTLEPGIPCCPPEGDAGTGMVATNSVAPRTGNVSAGTSVFAMAVLERPLSRVYPEIDMVATPAGAPAAMVHCNTCTPDLDAWVHVMGEAAAAAGAELDTTALYTMLYRKALEGEPDCGGLIACNYYSGEPVTGLSGGRPLLVRRPDSRLTLANLMRAHLCAAMATLKLGMDILTGPEQVALDRLTGHGGLFKVEGVAQRLMASALDVPVAVMDTAGEGGPWGMALLAAYAVNRAPGESLTDYLSRRVFSNVRESCLSPNPKDRAGFAAFLDGYCAALTVERTAVNAL